MKKFQNKYRIPSARAAWWNYANPGAYFITICTHNRICLFGEIHDGAMYLSPIGQIVEQEWNRSFEIRTELFCDSLAIMPNHIHGIINIVGAGFKPARIGEPAFINCVKRAGCKPAPRYWISSTSNCNWPRTRKTGKKALMASAPFRLDCASLRCAAPMPPCPSVASSGTQRSLIQTSVHM